MRGIITFKIALTVIQTCFQDFNSALADANAVIAMGAGHNAKTYLVKGDALYHLGEFEHALVHYHRALQRLVLKQSP